MGRRLRRFLSVGVLAAFGVGVSTYIASAHPIVVDGSNADWLSRQPAQDNTAVVARNSTDQGEYIWRDASSDEVGAPDPSVDIRQVRYTATTTALNVLVRLGATSSTGAGAQQVQIALDEDRVAASGTAAFVGNADTSVASTSRWEKLIQTRFGSANTNVAVYTSGNATPLFTGSAAQGATDGSVELSVSWADLGLSGPPSSPLRFTVASFKANADDTTQDIAGSNARDVVTDYGAPGTSHTTTDETGDGIVNYSADVWFNGSGDVYAPLVVHRFLAAPSPSNGAEYVDVRNVSGDPVDLTNFKLGNEPTAGGVQGMYKFPAGTTLAAGAALRVATKATDYKVKFGTNPDAEFAATDATVPDMVAFPSWASGTTQLGDAGDELVALGTDDTIEDVVPYGTGSYTGVTAHSAPAADQIIQRNGVSHDTDDASADFNTAPAPCTTGPAPTKTWTGGGGNTSWQNANNWFPVGVPTGSDNVCIPDQTPDITVTFPAGGTNNVLSVQSAEAIQVANGATLNITSLSDSSSIQTLNLASGTLGGVSNVTVTSAFNWTGGTLAGGGSLTVPATAQLTISSTSGKELSQRKLFDNSATTTDWTGAGIGMDTGAEWHNSSVLLLDGDQDVSNNGGPASSFVNAGTVTKFASAGDPTFVDIPFSNSGTVNANVGDLRFRNDGTDSGSYAVAAGATVKFEGGTRTLQASSSVTGLGTVGLTGSIVHENGTYNVATTTATSNSSDFNGATTLSTLSQGGGTVSFNVATTPTTVNLGGGTLTGTGNMTIAGGGAFNWTGGALAGAAATTVPASASLTIAGNSGKAISQRKLVDNSATATDWTGAGICLDTAAEWDINSTVLIDGDQDICNNGGPASSIVNTGTVRKSASAGDPTLIDIPFSTSGAVNVNVGELRLRNDGSDSGSYTVAAGAVLKFEGGTRTLQASSSVTGAGTVGLTGTNVHENGTYNVATTSVASATSDFNGPTTFTTYNHSGGTLNLNSATTPTTVNLSGGTATGSANMTIAGGGSFNWTGGTLAGSVAAVTTTIPASAALTISGSGGKAISQRKLVDNSATTTDWTGSGICMDTAAEWDINSTVLIDGDQDICNNGGPASSIVNTGTVRKSASAGDPTLIDIPFSNNGAVNANAGELRFRNSGTDNGSYAVAAGAVLKFEGGTRNLQPSSSVSGAGTLAFTSGVTNIAGTYDITGTTSLSSGTAAFNNASPDASSATVNESGGDLNGTGGFDVTGTMTWSGGSMSNVGSTNILAGATLKLIGGGRTLQSGRTLDNAGTVEWDESGWNIGGGTPSGATFINEPSGLLKVRSNQAINDFGAGVILNLGTIEKFGTPSGGWVGNYGAEDAGGATDNTSSLALPSWTKAGTVPNFTAVQYGTTGFPTAADSTAIGGGANFFAGGPNTPQSKAFEDVDVSSIAGSVDAGVITANLDALIGGKGAEADNGTLTAEFLDGSKNPVGPAPIQLGPVTAANRGSVTALLPRAGNAAVPAGTRFIRVTMTANRVGSGYNDAYFDNVRLRLSDGQAVLGLSTIGTALENDGTIKSDEATLSLNGGDPALGSDSGSFVALPGAAIGFGGGTRNIGAAAAVSGPAGTIKVTGGTTNVAGTYSGLGQTFVSAGTINFNHASDTVKLVQTGGALGGSGLFHVTGIGSTWTGGGEFGSGETRFDPGTDLAIDGAFKQLGNTRTFRNQATINWNGGSQIRMGDCNSLSTFRNEGTLLVNFAATLEACGGQVVNTGTITKAAGANTFTITAPFDNDGTLNANVGTVALQGGGIDQSTGTYNVPAAGTLQFSGGDHTLAPASAVSGLGTVLMTGGQAFVNSGAYDLATTTIQSGNLFLNTTGVGDTTPAKTAALNESAGALAGNERLDVSGNLSWTGGAMTGSGETRLLPTAVGVFDTGFKSLGNTRTFRNQATINWNGGSQLRMGDCNSLSTFRNEGTLNVKFDNTFFEDCGGQVLNTGTIAKTAGTGVSLMTPALDDTGGTLDVETGTVDVTNLLNYNAVTHTLTGGAYVVAGTLRVPSLDIATNAAKIVLDGPASALVDRNNAVLGGLRNFTTNAAAGDFTIKNGRNLFSSGARGPDLTNFGVLRGTGTYFENVTNNGTVAPGASPGIMTVNGNYTQSAAGTTQIEVGGIATAGVDYDRLVVTGTAALGGTLSGVALGGFTQPTGTGLDVVVSQTASGRSGTYSSVTSTPDPLTGGYAFQARYLSDRVQLFAVPKVSVADQTLTEGDTGTVGRNVTVTLSAASSETVTVHYATSAGTATAGTDYTDTSGDLTFTPGQTSKTFALPVIGDTLDEADETVNVALTSPANANLGAGNGTLTIADDDSPPSVAIDDVSKVEGNSGTTAFTFTVHLSAPSGKTVTVDATTADGTAHAPADYTAKTQTLTFAPGETSKTFTVDVAGETLNETNETFLVNLSNPSNVTLGDGQATGTIVDDDTLTWSIADKSVTEGDSGTVNASFAVSLNRASAADQTIHFATSDGAATAPADYTATSGTLTIPAGQTSGTVTVPVKGDTLDEVDESFNVTLSAASEGNIARATAIGTILDDDGPSVSVADAAAVQEGDSGTANATFTVSLSAVSPQAVSADFATSDGTATAPGDYTPTSGTVTIPAGQTAATISVPVKGDTLDEANESFAVTLSNPVHGSLNRAVAAGTIVDDDGPAVSVGDLKVAEGDSGTHNALVPVTLSAPSPQNVSVAYATAAGTATAGDDYNDVTGTVTIPAGATSATVAVPIVGDVADEADETVLVNISSPVNGTISRAQGTLTIDDDDGTKSSGSGSSLSIDDATVTEGNSGTTNADFTVTLTPAAAVPVTVGYTTLDASAHAGSDYVATSGSLIFAPGETTKHVLVAVDGDRLAEPNEQFLVSLSSADAAITTGVGTGTITNDDAAPVAAAQSATLNEDTPKSVTLGATDGNGDPLTFAIVSGPSHGTLGAVSGNTVTYTPSANYNGPDSFTFKANDGVNDSNVATVSLTVTPVDDAPVANGDSYNGFEDSPVTVPAPGLLANDSDVDTPSFGLHVVGVSPSSHGVIDLHADGSFTYTPLDPNFHGTDSFTYKTNDGTLDSAPATVTITLAPVNDPPVANAQSVTTNEDTAKPITLTGSDVDFDTLTFSIVNGPAHGTLSGSGANRTYTPDPNFNGTDSFTFKANDGQADSGAAVVSITVNPVNDAPVAAAKSSSSAEDTPSTLTLGAGDVDGDPLTFAIVAGPTHGTLGAVSGNTVTYTPSANYNGPDSFTFKANDGSVDSNVATVSLTVTPVNDPPVAVDDAATTPQDTAVDLNVLGNDSDVDGDTLSLSSVGSAAHGSVTVAAGKAHYVPNAGYTGGDAFTYVVADGHGGTATGHATVEVTPASPVNHAPNASDTALSFPEDNVQTVTLPATDAESSPLTYAIVAGPAHGTLGAVTGNRVTYTPAADYNGPDSFTFKANDGSLDSNVATVTLTLTPVNDAPVAASQSVSTNEDTSKPVVLGANDVDGDALTFSIVSGPAHGTLTGTGANRTYTPAANYNGDDSFAFRVNDGALNSGLAVVSIAVNAVNDAPAAAAQSATLLEDAPKTITFDASDVEGDALTYSIVAGPSHGILGAVSGKTVTYTPAPDYNGPDSFTFKANDGGADSNVATVSLTVTAVNDPPVAVDDAATTPQDTAVDVNVLANDSDVDGDALTLGAVGAAHHGAVSIAAGKAHYVPNAGYAGGDSFTYTVSDGHGGLTTGHVAVDVTSTAPPPPPPPPPPPTPVDTSVTMTGSPAAVQAGDTITYTATVKTVNDATGVTFTDAFPASANFISATSTQGTCAQASAPPKNVTCAIGSLASGSTVTIVIKAVPHNSGLLTNAVQVAANESELNPANNFWVVTTNVTARNSPAPPPPPPASPPPPPGEKTPPGCVVPKLGGQNLKTAKKRLAAAHCKLGKVTRAYSTKVLKGKVVKQSPRPGAKLANGAPVNVTVSRGRRRGRK